jgi:hypothetical protein
MDLKETGSEDVDWIHLAKDMDQWRTLVNTQDFLLTNYHQEGIWSEELIRYETTRCSQAEEFNLSIAI